MEPAAVDESAIARELAAVNAALRRISETLDHRRAPEAVGAGSDGSDGSGSPETTIEHVERAAVDRRIWEVARAAREIRSVQAERTVVGDAVRERAIEKLAAGVSYRTIVHADTLRNATIARYFQEIHRLGDHHRVIDEPVQHMIVIDRRAAFVPAVPGDPAGGGALLIRQPGMVATLIDLFEHLWARGVDLEPAGSPVGRAVGNPLASPGPDPELTDVERQVLDLLIRVDKDETAAREMGVSVRTFRRHVANLMERLGAANRFHAAYLARERGWI